MNAVKILWFRRDLRTEDNTALKQALQNSDNTDPVQCLFIFDQNILAELPPDDARISFIYHRLLQLDKKIQSYGASLLIKTGNPLDVWTELVSKYRVSAVYYNRDYEPYALERDKKTEYLLHEKGIPVHTYKDHVIFEPHEILKSDGSPYMVFTPYKKKWLSVFRKIESTFKNKHSFLQKMSFAKNTFGLPALDSLGFLQSSLKVPEPKYEVIKEYDSYRDFPALDATGHFGPHLRFGTLSIRTLVQKASELNEFFLSELIWREFFIQILFHFPRVTDNNFREKYDYLKWRNDLDEFKQWSRGETGYPIVDAGMRQLNQTGYMHNRVRMITAGFLTKHLLIDWKWGEAYFAEKLLDYELASNNGNWQWAAGTGCDAAPYFRIFNPETQQKKFDPQSHYIKQYVPEYKSSAYSASMVEHKFARERALAAFKEAIDDYKKQTYK
jgi:deoxyribodipyrimidine photo-lyase